MLLQVILEGIGLGVLLILVCAIGICKGAVGMVHLYSQEVQERCVTLGLTTHAKIKRNALIFKAVCIPGYAKTRDTYVAYRKAGYSKKFLAEHESEITIHKAAKNYFDGLGFKKLPTIKALNTEYAELLAEKKAAYADYRKAREEMKELLTAKANIDRILELDKELEEANKRREKEAEQR